MSDSPLEFHNTDDTQKDFEIEERLPCEYFKDEEEELLVKARLKLIRSMIVFLETKSKTSKDYTDVKTYIDMYNAFITNPKSNNK